jgi:hypothetical protein
MVVMNMVIYKKYISILYKMSNNYIGTAIFQIRQNNIRNIQRDFSSFTTYNNLLIMYLATVCVGISTK